MAAGGGGHKNRHITLLVFRRRELGSIKTIIRLNARNEGNQVNLPQHPISAQSQMIRKRPLLICL